MHVPHDGSQRQPSLSSQVIASPSPATPDVPWSASRQYSPGSEQVPSSLSGEQPAGAADAGGDDVAAGRPLSEVEAKRPRRAEVCARVNLKVVRRSW